MVFHTTSNAIPPPSDTQCTAARTEPAYGTATVDGDPKEWNLAEDGTGDFFANMHRAGKCDDEENHPLESKLYLRYDCKNHVLFILVLTKDGVPGLASPDDAWLKIEGDTGNLIDGNDDTDCSDNKCFQWVYGSYIPGTDQQDGVDKVIGWEASVPLAIDTYKFRAHIEVYDDGAAQTSATTQPTDTAFDLVLNCKPTAIELKSFKGKSGGDLNVELEWETASETNNAGFYLYRARGKKGKFKKINTDIIASKGDTTTGANYTYPDQVKNPGNYFYKLEDVDSVDATSTLHGPIKVKVRKK